MATFSQLVDLIASEVRRPDMLAIIATYLNQTIREVHFDPRGNGAILYKANRFESQLTVISDTSPLVWEIPDPTCWQAMAAVRYDGVWTDGAQTWPKEVSPNRGLAQMCNYYYQAGNGFAFAGAGASGATVSLFYYQYPRALKYKAAGVREASYDVESGWSYLTATTLEDQANARALCTNWLLDRWSDVIAEGLRAKIYKRVSDTQRAQLCYSAFTSQRQGLFTSESMQVGDYGG